MNLNKPFLAIASFLPRWRHRAAAFNFYEAGLVKMGRMCVNALTDACLSVSISH